MATLGGCIVPIIPDAFGFMTLIATRPLTKGSRPETAAKVQDLVPGVRTEACVSSDLQFADTNPFVAVDLGDAEFWLQWLSVNSNIDQLIVIHG
jgi:hypothetical protein